MSEKKVTLFTEEQVKSREEKAAATARAEAEKQHAAARHTAEVAAFLEGQRAKGHYVAAWDQMGVTALVQSLPADVTVTFSDGAKEVKKSPYDVMRAFLESLPKLVTLEEIAKGKSVPQGDTAGDQLRALAVKFAEDKKVPYNTALIEVQKQHPDLAKEVAAHRE